MMRPMPYFMPNKDWYKEAPLDSKEYEELNRGYVLTDEAPQEAIDSYNEFYEVIVDDNDWIPD